jgi:hypothetical protein
VNWIEANTEDDRDCRRRGLGGESRCCAARRGQDGDAAADEIDR